MVVFHTCRSTVLKARVWWRNRCSVPLVEESALQLTSSQTSHSTLSQKPLSQPAIDMVVLTTSQSQVLRIVQLTVVRSDFIGIADHVCVVCVCRVFNVAGDRSVNRWRLATDCCRHTASDSSVFCKRQKRRHNKQLQTM